MDSFVDDLERMRMKRKFKDSFNEEDSQIYFGKTRHNLLEDFEATPTKPLRESGSRSFLNYVSPNTDSVLLKKEISMKDAEIIALKANITQLENQISQCEVAQRQAKIEQEKEILKLKTEKDRDGIKVSEMRSKLLYVMEKEKNAREDINRLQEELEKQNLEASKKLLAVQKEKMLATDQAQQLTANFLQTETDLRNQIFKLMRDTTSLQSRLSEAEAQLSLRKMTQAENEELHKEIEEVKKSLMEEKQKNKALEKQFSEQEDNLLITKALKNDLDMVPMMKAELEKLRMDNEHLRQNEQNTLLLEEEIRSLKSRLDYASSFQEKITALEVENEELQGRLQRWEAVDTSGSRRPMSPSSLSKRVQELEHLSASFVLSQGDLQSELTISQRKLEKSEEEINRLTLMLSAEEKKVSNLVDMDKRLRRKILLVTMERDCYKGLLDSYESEVTINFDAERKSQIQRLEDILNGYKEQNTALEAEVRTLSEKLTMAQSRYDQSQQQLDAVQSLGQQKTSRESEDLIRQLQESIAVLENTLLKTQEEKDILEARIEQRDLQGDYDPSKIKIIHFTMNPFAKAQKIHQDELQRLREENDVLRKRNQILEEQGHVDDITMQVKEKLKQPSPSKEVEEIKAQLKREETRNQRLMEVFKKKSQEFREICYQLTGYKIDFPCSNQYRLTSMYAESPHDYLLFQQNENGEIMVLQTDFSMTLQEPMEMYLQNQNSIPMFLSHITMDLFSRQTMNLG